MQIAFENRPAYSTFLPELGLEAEDLPALLEAESYSEARLRRARSLCSGLVDAKLPGVAAFALGSLGRREASEASDLDLAFIYDEREVEASRAARLRSRMLEALEAHFDVPQKTFNSAIELSRLVRNVGGALDTNETLTYRALLLTEGAWLHNSLASSAFKQRIFSAYATGKVTRGRFLNSLANDLHRYYRTLCVDYRFKVEEDSKSWAIRVLKLRHTRKLWHLANLATQCWAVDALEGEERDAIIGARLGWPPLARIATALRHFGAVEHCTTLFVAQDRFLSSMSSDAVRESLEELHHAERYESPLYRSLHYNAEQLDEGAADVVRVLMTHCEAYLLRFCLL
jgi:predicted nucleotidyltransferase